MQGKGYANNRFKRKDSLSDVMVSLKHDTEAEIGELFFSREAQKLSFKKNVGDFVRYDTSSNPGNVPYKVFTALLTQSGTDAPVAAHILENTLEVEVSFEYGSPGNYVAIFDKTLFNSPTAYVTLSNPVYGVGADGAIDVSIAQAVPVFFNAIGITTGKVGGNFNDGILGSSYAASILEVRVYNDNII